MHNQSWPYRARGPGQGSEAMLSVEREPITAVWKLNPFSMLHVQRKPQICPITEKGKYNAAADCLSHIAS